MAQICKVCQHSATDAINKAILQGEAHTRIAERYGMNHINIRNHAQNHLPSRMVNAFRKREAMEGLNMMEEFTTLMSDIKNQIQRLKDKGKDALTIRATDTLIRLYQTMAQFASVYYEQQGKEREAEDDKKEDRINQIESNKLAKLNDQELEWLTWLEYRFDRIPEHMTVPKPSGYNKPIPKKRGPKPTQINVPSEGIQEERPSIEEKLVKLYGKEKEEKTDDSFQNVIDKAKEFMTKAEYSEYLKAIGYF